MKNGVMVMAAAVALGLGAGFVCAADAEPAAKEAAAVKKQTLCPVMGGPINSSIFVDVDGKRVYFCCKACLPEFNKEPAKFVTKMEKDGVTLEKAPAAPAAKPAAEAASAAKPAAEAAPVVQAGEGCAAGGCCK